MTKRKLFLVIADVLLLALCIVQCTLSSRDSAKMFEFRDSPDKIIISGEKGLVNLVYENDEWFVGDEKYPASASFVDSIIESLSSIRTLDKVGTANSESSILRYELNEGKKLSVAAYKGEKLLRSVEVGKDATASSQDYITIDGNKDIYLASGNLKTIFDKSVDELRSRVIWSLDANSINSVEIIPVDGNNWSVSKSGNGENVSWNVSGVTCDIDSTKALEWFKGFASISTPVWHGKGDVLGGEKIVSARITTDSKNISIDIFEKPAVSEDAKPIYWATCSETPYTFEIAQYAVQKFQKNIEELSK